MTGVGRAISFLALCSAGCAVGPEYHRPAPLPSSALPAAFEEAGFSQPGEWKTAEPSAHRPRGPWWEIFDDRELERLETLAAADNQELAVLRARFEGARALVESARSGLFPRLAVTPAYVRQRTSANEFSHGRAAGAGFEYGTFDLPLEAEWEIDLWGRVRRGVEASSARLIAAADDLESARLSIEAEVAIDHFALAALDRERAFLERTLVALRRSLELTRNRRRGGVATDLDVAQAETLLQGTEAQLPAVDRRRSSLRHALAALCGKTPGAIAFETAAGSAPAVPAVPPSLPSELLERRPDVAAAERRMAAANSEVGVAAAAFYPRVRLRGLAGFQSIDAGTLFDWPSRLWAVGASIELPLFTGGKNLAELAAARAGYDEAVASYRRAVLTAFQEVEDQLSAQRLLAVQIQAESAALAAALRALEIAENRYQAGLVTYLEVATAQSAALAHERSVVGLGAERLAACATLIKATGGSWQKTRDSP